MTSESFEVLYNIENETFLEFQFVFGYLFLLVIINMMVARRYISKQLGRIVLIVIFIFSIGITARLWFVFNQYKALEGSNSCSQIEAALSNLLIISSDCYNGPKEFLLDGEAGLLFESNKKGELKNKLDEFCNIKDTDQIKLKKIKAKKNCIKYTMFRHNIYLKEII